MKLDASGCMHISVIVSAPLDFAKASALATAPQNSELFASIEGSGTLPFHCPTMHLNSFRALMKAARRTRLLFILFSSPIGIVVMSSPSVARNIGSHGALQINSSKASLIFFAAAVTLVAHSDPSFHSRFARLSAVIKLHTEACASSAHRLYTFNGVFALAVRY